MPTELTTRPVRPIPAAALARRKLAPGHYDLGFHAIATVAAFGAAAGSKSQFGTMCKPLTTGVGGCERPTRGRRSLGSTGTPGSLRTFRRPQWRT